MRSLAPTLGASNASHNALLNMVSGVALLDMKARPEIRGRNRTTAQ